MNLYTIIISFDDKRQGLGQYASLTPLDALKEFIGSNESVEGFNRQQIMSAINLDPFIQVKNFKGIWIIRFLPKNILGIVGPNNDRILGGYVLQSDPNIS